MRHPEPLVTEASDAATAMRTPAQLALALAAATLFALVVASQYHMYWRMLGHVEPLGPLLEIQLARWYLWVALCPFIFAIAQRWRPGASVARRWVGMQIATAVGFALAHAVLSALVERWIGTSSTPLPLTLSAHVTALLPLDIVTYGAIAATYLAVDYYHRYRRRELSALRLEARLAQTHLQVLRSQLQPHFLFNTLNTVSALMHEDVEAADAMLSALSDLLRLALHGDGSHEVPLRQEVEFLRRYLDIMRLRFRGLLTAEVEIDPAALDALVPILVLQPLVENAVRHGIAKRLDGGRVIVRAERLDGTLRLRVADNGPGLPAGWEEDRHSGVGLRNTRARLHQLYGAAHRIEVRNQPSGGVELTLTVPFRLAAGVPASVT
jgi:signal transduction histidine kinase